MQRIDGGYLYNLGHQIHALTEIVEDTPLNEVIVIIVVAEHALDQLLHSSIYKLRFCLQTGEDLLVHLKAARERTFAAQGDSPPETLNAYEVQAIKWALTAFETNLASELAQLDIYLVAKKGGLDTSALLWRGEEVMPSGLAEKVPEAVRDIREATKCIAFEVPTAAAFHLHRANEAVLKRYFDVVAAGRVKPPKERNMGAYLAVMNDNDLGDKRVRAALKDIKDLHRNPIIHPEQSIESVEDAIDLMGAIRAAIGAMLKSIPVGEPSPLSLMMMDALKGLEKFAESPPKQSD